MLLQHPHNPPHPSGPSCLQRRRLLAVPVIRSVSPPQQLQHQIRLFGLGPIVSPPSRDTEQVQEACRAKVELGRPAVCGPVEELPQDREVVLLGRVEERGSAFAIFHVDIGVAFQNEVENVGVA